MHSLNILLCRTLCILRISTVNTLHFHAFLLVNYPVPTGSSGSRQVGFVVSRRVYKVGPLQSRSSLSTLQPTRNVSVFKPVQKNAETSFRITRAINSFWLFEIKTRLHKLVQLIGGRVRETFVKKTYHKQSLQNSQRCKLLENESWNRAKRDIMSLLGT